MSDTEQPTDPPTEEQPAPESESQPTEQPAEEQPEDSQPAEPTTDEQPAEDEPQPTSEEPPSSDPQPEDQPKEEEGEAAAPTAEGEESPAAEGTEGEKKEEEGEGEKEEEKEEEPKEEPVIITPEGNPLWLSDEDVLGKGLPESEVENFKHFYFKQTHSLQAWYETLKDYAFQTEFITLSKEEIEALSAEGDPSDEQQAVLTALEDRVNQAIELYGEDGALVRVNGRSPKDAVLDRNEEAFIQEIRDAVVNDLEVAKQAANAYAIWKDQQHQPGVFKRGIDKIRRSFRRTRTHSTGRREQKPKLEEEEKKDEETKPEGEAEGEAKPEGEGEAAEPKPAEEGGTEVTVEVDVEGGEAEDKPTEDAQPEEKPAEETPAEPEPEAEPAPEPEAEAPKEEETETPATPKEDDTPAPKEEDGEIQKVEDGEEKKEEEEAAKDTEEEKPSTPKKKTVREHHHQNPKAKAEPLDNQVLRAFLRVAGARYRVKDGKEAVEFVRKSDQIRKKLNQLKAFGGVEGVQVSMSVIQWQDQVPLYGGMNFRGFVYKNELTALSQVNDSVYFPNVDYYKSTIQFKVQEFFKENIQDRLKELESYIIDFYVAPEKVFVTRLKPFYTNVGACLFIWSEHGRVLTQGPFEFRIVETPKLSPDGYSSFQPYWATMFNSVLQQKRDQRRQSTRGCVLL